MSKIRYKPGDIIMCEITILMPCLNEAETLEVCIKKAKTFLQENNLSGEILVADNGSTDGSQEIAILNQARLVKIEEKGYGNALWIGGANAKGKYVIMGDSDDSYDFYKLMPFVEKLREGYDLVIGNRFVGGIEDGAMPWLHQYIGNPMLSFMGRIFFKSQVKDFHCGLRGYNRESIMKLDLKTTGMEYASEMIVMAELNHLKIAQVPITLKKDGRSGKSHLRSFQDGWRHLKFLFMYAPNWLFLYPSIALILIGALGSVLLITDQIMVFKITFGIHTLLYCMGFLDMGFDIIILFLFVKLYAYNNQFIPKDMTMDWNRKLKGDNFISIGFLLVVVGIVLSTYALVYWKQTGYARLLPEIVMKIAIPAVLLLELGIKTLFSGFVIDILKISGRK